MRLRRCSSSTTDARRWTRSRPSRTRSWRVAAIRARSFRTLGHAVLREDAGFHDYQQVDIAWRRLRRRAGSVEAHRTLVAPARWLAAHYPTRRAQEQTHTIALRLHRGESLYEQGDAVPAESG